MKKLTTILALGAILSMPVHGGEKIVIPHGKVVGDRGVDNPKGMQKVIYKFTFGFRKQKCHTIKDLKEGTYYRIFIPVKDDTLDMGDKGAFVLEGEYGSAHRPEDPSDVSYIVYKMRQFKRK